MDVKQKKWDGNNPWLGLQTYQEGIRLWGRDTEVSTLTDIICNNLATVVFGKSGIGKSSLIHAGISPEIRKRGMMPIYIRLEHNTDTSYIDQIEKAVGKVLEKEDKLDKGIPQMGLWDFFHRHTFYDKEHREIFPVIIIDQFEEIYTLADAAHKHQAQDLFEEFADLLNNKKPEKVLAFENEALKFTKSKIEVGGDDVLTFRIQTERRLSYFEDSNLHMVVCLREDYLYYLERNTSKIPSLKINRFSLQALDRSSAREVITQPRPGLFSDEEANHIISKISTFNDEGKEEIDPTILSIFLFKYYNRKGNVSTDNIISEFYADETKGISATSLAYLEDHLITGEGFRHFSPYNDAIASGVTEQELQKLIISRIITVETRKNHRYIEFSHDVICPIAKSNREQRRIDEQARKLRKRVLAATGLVFFAIILIGTFLYQNYNLKTARSSLQVSKAKNASIRAHYMIVQGDVLDAIKLLLNITPDKEEEIPEYEKALNEAYDSLYADYTCIAILNHLDDVKTAEFCENDQCIVTSSTDGVCRIWNAQSGELQKELESDIKGMTSASLNRDGSRAIASFNNGEVTIWDTQSKKILKTIKSHTAMVNYACFSPDGQFAVTASNDKTAKLWDTKTGNLIETIAEHKEDVNCAVFSTDGKKIITSSDDGSAIVFDKDSHTSRTIFSSDVPVEYAEYNNDDTKIAIITNSVVYIINANNGGTELVINGHDDKITSATFSPDGKAIATSSHDKTIKLWNLQTGKEIHTYEGHSNIVTDVVFSPDGKFIMSTSSDNEARIWNVGSGKPQDIIQCEMGELSLITYSPDGKYVAALSVMGKAKIWEVESMERICSFSIPERASSIVFNHNSDKVVVTSESNILRVFDVASGNRTDSIEVTTDTNYDNALFTDYDKAIVAYSQENKAVKWWIDKHSFDIIDSKAGEYFTCVTPLPDDVTCLLSFTNKNTIYVSNLNNLTPIKEFDGHATHVIHVSCSHNGKKIISGSSDNTAIIWDMASGEIVHKLRKHSTQIYFAEFSDDDNYVITASADGTIILWNAETGVDVATRKISSGLSTNYIHAFNPIERQYIISNGFDIRFYRLQSPAELIQVFSPRYERIKFTKEEMDYYSL